MKTFLKYAVAGALASAVAIGAVVAQERGQRSNSTTIAEFFIGTNEQVITILEDPKAEREDTAKAKKKIEATIKKLKAANTELRAIDAKLGDPEQAGRYGPLLIEAIELQGAINPDINEAMSYWITWPRAVLTPIDGLIPIEDLTPINPPLEPSNPAECEQAGEAVKNDCLIASQMLENCGAIDTGTKVAMQFSCQTAGQSEETACNLAISQGRQHSTREPNQALAAEITCRRRAEQRNVDSTEQTETAEGN